jgi:ribosome maturation factor RimP
MNSAFDFWIGEQVVVKLDLGQIKTSVRGSILEERADTIMIRIFDGTEVEIYKTMVLAVEEGKAPASQGRRLTA